MRALSLTLIVAACTGLLMMTVAPGRSTAFQASTRVQSMITFVQPSTASKVSDVSLGEFNPRGNDRISLSTDGILSVIGDGGDTKSQGQPSVIKINNTRDSVVNFVPTNYRPSSGIDSMQAHCSLQAGGSTCIGSSVSGGVPRTLYIGMDMTVADGVELQPEGSKKRPSFDMSIVYQ